MGFPYLQDAVFENALSSVREQPREASMQSLPSLRTHTSMPWVCFEPLSAPTPCLWVARFGPPAGRLCSRTTPPVDTVVPRLDAGNLAVILLLCLIITSTMQSGAFPRSSRVIPNIHDGVIVPMTSRTDHLIDASTHLSTAHHKCCGAGGAPLFV